MGETWIKLYRKSLSNDVRRHDPTAWRLFETLLLLVDSKTGKWAGGIYQLTEADGSLNSNTIYKALKRLEEKGMIVKKSNTRYSEISICKFALYANGGNTSRLNEGETQAKPSKTLTRKKEVRSKNIDTNVSSMAVQPRKTISLEIDEAFSAWERVMGYQITSLKQKNRYAATNLIKTNGLEKLVASLEVVKAANLDKYNGIRVSDFVELQANMNRIHQWKINLGQQVNTSRMKGVTIS